MLSQDMLYSSVAELAAGLRNKQFTSVELTEAYLARLDHLGPQLNAVVTITHERALEQAHRADQQMTAGQIRGPLHGIPYGVKDLLATQGIKTTGGTRIFAQNVPDEDSTVVRRLREAGAVLVAKLAMVEEVTGGSYRYPSASLTGPCRNPWNSARWAGGSSSGCGAAVAAGLVGFAIGEETWGSIVCPSAFCGVSGLRPTYGRVSRYGAMTFSWTMDKLGPFARCAEDCGAILAAISGVDPKDPTTNGEAFVQRTAGVSVSLKGKKIGFIREQFDKYGEPEVQRTFEQSLDVLRDLGADVQNTALPDFPYDAVANVIMPAEAAAGFEDLIASGRTADIIDQEGKVSLYSARLISAVDYLKCMRIRRLIQEEASRLFDKFDVLVAPGMLVVAPPVTANLDEVFKGGGEIVTLGNLAGLPAVSVPNGFGRDRLPVGLQIVGKPFDEATLIDVGRTFQAKTSWHRQRPPI